MSSDGDLKATDSDTSPPCMKGARRSRRLSGVAGITLALVLPGLAHGADVAVHSSNRYYQDSTGKPLFLIGYYAWAAVVDGYTIDHASSYAGMMNQGSPFKINYIRIGAQSPRMSGSSNPPAWNGATLPCPYAVDGSNRANLNSFNSVFWTGLANQCALGQQKGVIVHVSLFDGVGLRNGPAWGYDGSWWNPANQTSTFYPNPDTNSSGGIDSVGDFYRTSEFNNGNPAAGTISYYEKRYIDQVLATTASYDNVIYEVGNELGADAAWNTAVIAYIKAHTSKVVTEGGNSGPTAIGSGAQGWSPHDPTNVAQYRSLVASVIGHGYPAWQDTDNNDWSCNFGYCSCGGSCATAWAAQDTGVRQAAWYSFVGGAAALGGFSVDWWDWWNPNARGFSNTLGIYMKNLQDFISNSGVQFQSMLPMHNLVSNNGINSCLSDVGLVSSASVEYVVYVLSDASVNVDLSGVSGNRNYRLYDPQSGAWSDPLSIVGGAVRTFNKPPGTSDWVIYIGNGGPGETCSSLQPSSTITLGTGIVPAVATDSQGNIHVIYVSGSNIQYKKYDPTFTLLTSETIATSNGAYYPHIMCDANSVPHITYTETTVDYANNCYYTNRIGGTWKTPIVAHATGGNGSLWYPRIGLWNNFAYVGYQIGLPNEQGLAGQIVKLTNLSTTPSIVTTVTTGCRTGISVDSNGSVHAVGRNGAAGTYYQKYDSNLNTVGGFQSIGNGYPGGSQAAWSDSSNITHLVAWSIQANGVTPCRDRCGMDYNNTGRQNPNGSFPSSIKGLLGGLYGSGPAGAEGSGSGFWNDDVAPVITKDALGQAYVAYRNWTPAGEGMTAKVNNAQFTQTCTHETTCNTDICIGAAFTPSITLRRWWNCEIAPALSGGIYVVWDYVGSAYLKPIDVGAALAEASIDMGTVDDTTNGITNVQNADGNTTPATIGGRDCRRNAAPISTNAYFYFDVSSSFAFQGNRPDVYITVNYYDTGTGTMNLEYDSIGPADIPHEYLFGGSVTRTNTNIWKSATFHVTNAYFGNRQNAGADFRFGMANTIYYLDTVSVTTQAPTAPVITQPAPIQYVNPNIPYTYKPTLVQGYPAPIWSLCAGPAGATAEAECGLITSWTPPPAFACYSFCLQASNSAGTDSKSWMVCVLSRMDFDKDGDVDMADFAHMQACFSGDTLSYGAGCADADLNGDGDVDVGDFSTLLPCMAGADHSPGC